MPNESIYDFEAKDINGNIKKLSEFKGTALLVVNTASKCGFTPQFDGLEKLFKNYRTINIFYVYQNNIFISNYNFIYIFSSPL